MVASVMLAGTGLGGACHAETAEVIHLGGPARVSPVTYSKSIARVTRRLRALIMRTRCLDTDP
jgi:hypothetical protein